jgi:hypothetical protein
MTEPSGLFSPDPLMWRICRERAILLVRNIFQNREPNLADQSVTAASIQWDSAMVGEQR